MRTARFPARATIVAGMAAVSSFAGADTLKERQEKISAAINKTRAAVVAIQMKGPGGAIMGSGSGVIVSADGLVMTAAHVVDAGRRGGDTPEISVVLPDGREVKGDVLGRDRGRDAAMVRILDMKDLPFVDLAPSDSVQQGEWCIAMGHPGGFDIQRGAPVRVGRLWLNNDKAFYRSDCTVSGGDSGGPLFDLDGKVIGIHSNISMDVSENRHVPVKVFHDDWERLKKGETWGDTGKLLADSNDLRPKKEEKPKAQKKPNPAPEKETPAEDEGDVPAKGNSWLGIEVDAGPDGPVVQQIFEGSPAQEAGLKLDDVILKIDGKAMGGTGDVINRVREGSPGDKLKFTVRRDGKEQDIVVRLAGRVK